MKNGLFVVDGAANFNILDYSRYIFVCCVGSATLNLLFLQWECKVRLTVVYWVETAGNLSGEQR